MRSKFMVAAALLLSGTVLFAQPGYSAHRPRGHRAPAAQAQAHVACTVLGCQPIPASCTPVEGKTPGGIPTGYDSIVCPPGVWPLR